MPWPVLMVTEYNASNFFILNVLTYRKVKHQGERLISIMSHKKGSSQCRSGNHDKVPRFGYRAGMCW